MSRYAMIILTRSVTLAALLTAGCCRVANSEMGDYAYVYCKGSPQTITRWTLEQNSARKIGDGLSALGAILQIDLTALFQEEPDADRRLPEVDAAISGFAQVTQRLLATAEPDRGTAERFNIPAADADRLVRWDIDHYARRVAADAAIQSPGGIKVNQKLRDLYSKLEPPSGSRYHDFWRCSLEDARRISWHPFSGRVSDVIAHASNVEARRIVRSLIEGKPDQEIQLKETLGPPIVLRPDLSRRLAEALRDRNTYKADSHIMCFEPGVQFDFYQDNRRVTVRICFHCQNLTAKFDDGQSSEMSQEVVFTPGYMRLLNLTKEAVPDDKEIQSLEVKQK